MGSQICPNCKVLNEYSRGYTPPPDKLCWKCQDAENEKAREVQAKAMDTSELIEAIVELRFAEHSDSFHSGGSPDGETKRLAEACENELNLRIPRRDGKKVG